MGFLATARCNDDSRSLEVFRCLVLILTLVVAVVCRAAASDGGAVRERILMDSDWRFALGHATDRAKDFGHGTGYFSYLAKTGYGDGPARARFDDRGWRIVNLPHDWAVEAPFDARASHSHGYKAIGPTFPERSVGWYRRSFLVPQADLGRRIEVEFDGVFRNARVFINGFLLGEHPSGYTGVRYDLTDYLRYGEQNVLVVRVDASMEEGWYYEGAGIYRHVWLHKLTPVHVARHGTWVRAQVSDSVAKLTIDTTLVNEGRDDARTTIEQTVLAPDGKQLAKMRSPALAIAGGAEVTRTDEMELRSPQLWSLERPLMHALVTVVRRDGVEVDRYQTPFGIRTIRFDPNAGFFLNGEHVVLKGTNNHQDHAGVGVAIPDALQIYRLQRLKAMGSNAYRVSHHPPTAELLDAADRLGMLVIDENRLMGSNELHRRELEAMIRRDRNHPSVILWSIGNEEWAIEGNVTGARIAATMQAAVKRLDATRPVTAALSGIGGTSTVIEVAGFNYVKNKDPDRQHAEYPWQISVGTEETTTQATRGIYFDDRPRAHLAPLADGSSGGNAELGWRHYAARPYAAGVFYWTGFDYRGEPVPFGFPAVGSQFGILDTCGFPKDSFYYLQSWWGTQDVLHIFPHWNWPARDGEELEVRAHTNVDEVELLLNGSSLGRKPVERNSHVSWRVKYAPGELVARGYRGGRVVMTSRRVTTGAPAAVRLEADRTTIKADGRDLAVVTVEIRDASGNQVPIAGDLVRFEVQGPGRIIGVGNGDPSSLEPDQYVESVRSVTLGEWQPPDPSAPQTAVTFEARFDRPSAGSDDQLTLLLTALGSSQSVYLNGHALYSAADPARARAAIRLDPAKLRASDNHLRIEAKPFEDRDQRESLPQLTPATLAITTPAGQWQRRAFNGLAQVIVQSTGKPGAITLKGIATGLTVGSSSVTAR